MTIGNPAFCLALYLTGVYFWGELQHFGDLSRQKIKGWPIRTRQIDGSDCKTNYMHNIDQLFAHKTQVGKFWWTCLSNIELIIITCFIISNLTIASLLLLASTVLLEIVASSNKSRLICRTQSWRSATLLKRDSNTGVFFGILRYF